MTDLKDRDVQTSPVRTGEKGPDTPAPSRAEVRRAEKRGMSKGQKIGYGAAALVLGTGAFAGGAALISSLGQETPDKPVAGEPGPVDGESLQTQYEQILAAGVAENIAKAEAMEPVVLSNYGSEQEAAAAVITGIFDCVKLGNVPITDEMRIEFFSSEPAEVMVPREFQLNTVFDTCIANYIDPTSPANIPVIDSLREINANTVIADLYGNEVTVTLGDVETNAGPDNTIEVYAPFHREVKDRPETAEDAYINSLLAVQDDGALRAVAPGSSYAN